MVGFVHPCAWLPSALMFVPNDAPYQPVKMRSLASKNRTGDNSPSQFINSLQQFRYSI